MAEGVMNVPDISLGIEPGKTDKNRISTDNKEESPEVSMSVSPICMKEGKRVAYVMFTDGERSAEGEIPGCIITSHKGYKPQEVAALEDYMKRELPKLKKMAAGINLLDAIMGKN